MEKKLWDDAVRQKSQISRRRKREEPQPINTLQDYALDAKGQQDVVFSRRLEESGKSGNAKYLPPMTEVLSYVAKLEKQPLWFMKSQESIVNSNALKFPELDVLTREYIHTNFMREPIHPTEHLCSNSICESERLGGFRIRALIAPSQPLNNWCFLCHLFYTNRLYFESLNRSEPTNKVFRIHHFCVRVDEPGEYRLDMTLMGENNAEGIFGPFPLYNCNNYTPTTFGKVRGWAESDVMVFRLSQTMPPSQIGSPCKNTLLASDPIKPQQPHLGYH